MASVGHGTGSDAPGRSTALPASGLGRLGDDRTTSLIVHSSPARTARRRPFGCWPPWWRRQAGCRASARPTGSQVGDDLLDAGDWSGPGGARTDPPRSRASRSAILETARGGMLRRGLGVTDADVAVILNVAEDHLGEWGVEDLAALVEAKFVVTPRRSPPGVERRRFRIS